MNPAMDGNPLSLPRAELLSLTCACLHRMKELRPGIVQIQYLTIDKFEFLQELRLLDNFQRVLNKDREEVRDLLGDNVLRNKTLRTQVSLCSRYNPVKTLNPEWSLEDTTEVRVNEDLTLEGWTVDLHAEPLCCVTYAIPEALKVRTITKGDPHVYGAAKPVQKSMWGLLQNAWQFSPTGRPLASNNIEYMLMVGKKEFSRTHIVSGDYSAATDGIEPAHSMSCYDACWSDRAKAICGRYGSVQTPEMRCIASGRRALDLHSVVYQRAGKTVVDKNGKKVKIVAKNYEYPQIRGQLMGSVTSFPVLCSINFCNFWVAYERFVGRAVEMEDVPCLVNGDDISFPSTPELYNLWLEGLDQVGFQLSVGKNYVHEKVVTMNSQFYHVVNDRAKQIEWCNTGLLHGDLAWARKRQGQIDDGFYEDGCEECPLAARANALLPSCENPVSTMGRFLQINNQEIGLVTANGLYNLFLSQYIGGIGIIPPTGFKIEVTRLQRRLAHMLKKKSRAENQPVRYNTSRVKSGTTVNKIIALKEKEVYLDPVTFVRPPSFFGPHLYVVAQKTKICCLTGPREENNQTSFDFLLVPGDIDECCESKYFQEIRNGARPRLVRPKFGTLGADCKSLDEQDCFDYPFHLQAVCLVSHRETMTASITSDSDSEPIELLCTGVPSTHQNVCDDDEN